MRHARVSHRSMTITGALLFLVGALLVGTVVVTAASASPSASGPTLTVAPHGRLKAGTSVTVSGTGLAHRDKGALLECNLTSGQPTTMVKIGAVAHAVSVGCTDPSRTRTSSSGTVGPRSFTIQTGTLGSWESGIDSGGQPAQVDSAAYPCPPTATQQSQGASCGIAFIDNKGQTVTRAISFRTSGGGTTTTVVTTTSTTAPLGCDPAPATATGVNTTVNPPTTGTLTVAPGTCLTSGQTVTLTGSGFADNVAGTFIECNSDPGQPTVDFLGQALPVSCTNAFSQSPGPGIVLTSATGTIGPVDFLIDDGTTGPPCGANCPAADSSGGNPTTDAAAYPCPPTPAQTAAGDDCAIIFGDEDSDAVTVPLGFSTTTTTTTTTTLPIGCDPVAGKASASSGKGAATVNPATCLVDGESVSVAVTGLTSGSTDTLGDLAECNSDQAQPTVSILGNAVPVSCTNPVADTFTPSSKGAADGTFDIVAGVPGPPCAPNLCTGTDSAGGDPATDAAAYPCPPTPAEAAAGDTCVLVVSDSAGDKIVVPLQFNPAVPSAAARRPPAGHHPVPAAVS